MTENNLEELVSAYRARGQGRDLIMEKVSALVYDRHRKYGFDDEDDAANALLKFRGRIGRFVDRFEDRGLPFDSYLTSHLRYLARTMRRDKKRARERESVCERALLDQGAPGEVLPPSALFKSELPLLAVVGGREGSPAGRRPRARGGGGPRCPAEAAALSRRLVFLAIKCAWEIDEEGLDRVAASAGVGRAWLSAAVEQARRSMESERARVLCLTQRRNASWTRLRLLENRLSGETEPYRRANLVTARDREKLRYERVNRDITALRIIVPNSLVARILGIPKGTVDSGLFYLRKHYGGRG